MSTETLKVDVLAVMQADIDAHEQRIMRGDLALTAYDQVNRKREARGAVAELIEIASEFHAGVQAHIDDCEHCVARNERMRKALARVGVRA